MIWLLLLIGLLFISFIHLIIPICVAVGGKQRKKSSLWWIARFHCLCTYARRISGFGRNNTIRLLDYYQFLYFRLKLLSAVHF